MDYRGLTTGTLVVHCITGYRLQVTRETRTPVIQWGKQYSVILANIAPIPESRPSALLARCSSAEHVTHQSEKLSVRAFQRCMVRYMQRSVYCNLHYVR